MAFCGNCGAQLQDGMKFCTSCGNEAGAAPARPPQPPPPKAGAPGTTILLAGKLFKLDTLYISMASLQIILSFFVPYYRITINDWSGRRSSWVSLFSSITGGDGSAFFAFFAFIVPIVIILMIVFKDKLTFLAGKQLLAEAGLCASGIIFSIIFMSMKSSIILATRQSTSVHAALTFFISMILYLAGIGIAVHGIRASKINADAPAE